MGQTFEPDSPTGMDRGVLLFSELCLPSDLPLLVQSNPRSLHVSQHLLPDSFAFYAFWNVDAGASATCHPGALFEDYIAGASLKNGLRKSAAVFNNHGGMIDGWSDLAAWMRDVHCCLRRDLQKSTTCGQPHMLPLSPRLFSFLCTDLHRA
jgi:hypothetical protein